MAGEQQNPHEGVWQQTLRDASSSGGTSFTNKSVLILGDRNCGKTSLVARLQGRDVNEFSKGLAVDYALMEIKDEKADEIASKINIWQLEGEEHHADLLKYAINAENVSESLAIIVLDLSAPWNLHDSLAKWLKVLDAHLRTLKLTRQAQDSLRSTNEKRFQTYKVPAADAPKHLPSLHKHKTAQDSSPSDSESSKQEDLPPLPNGVLDRNLGIPILVVGCKADSLESHARENFMKDSDFEYIQRDLRKTCLSYGAGLIYVSSRKDNNCSLLKDYIISVLYGISFYQEPEVYEKDLVFVPIGWDSPSKVELIELSGNYNNDNFSQVIFKPRSLAQREQESSVANDIEDEQSFLSHLRDTLEKMDLAASRADQLNETTPNYSISSSSSFQSEYSSPVPQNPGLSTTPLPTTPLNSGSRLNATTPAQTPTKGPVDIQSLNSFFSNLLERTPGKKPTAPSDPSSPASFT